MAYDSIWMVPALIGITLGVGFVAGGYPAFFLSSFRPVAVLQGALKAGASNALMRENPFVRRRRADCVLRHEPLAAGVSVSSRSESGDVYPRGAGCADHLMASRW
ncbi:MAG TPA: hypothetical protein DIT99_29785, partial [Candidatus Latescibacteria bacterium]|nr:hypothetical protein [Candidatus Latescibacterota bacterium]